MLSSASCGMAAIGRDIVERQAVPGMRLDAILGGERGHVGDPAQLDRLRLADQMRVAAGMELDHRRAEPERGVELGLARLDEQADADPAALQPLDERAQRLKLPRRVQPALGGPLLAPLGDDAGGMGPMGQRDPEHLLGRRHLQVERQVDRSSAGRYRHR